jgi:hypothetical protein
MIIDEGSASYRRCCGPPGCGWIAKAGDEAASQHVLEEGERYCLGQQCMGWQNLGRFYLTPNGDRMDRPDLDGKWQEVTLGCCGLAPERGADPDPDQEA